MPSSDYTSIPSTGKLKLKGGPATLDPKISKKKKKHRPKDPAAQASLGGNNDEASGSGSGSGNMARALQDEDRDIAGGQNDEGEGAVVRGIDGDGKEMWQERGKTEAERRWEEQRRRRVSQTFLSSGALAAFYLCRSANLFRLYSLMID